MKTTVEIDDELFRQAKILAAKRGITLKQLFQRGLLLAMAQEMKPAEAQSEPRKRVKFPLIEPAEGTREITSEEVYKAMRDWEDEEAERYAGFMRC
jgi:hypothetical protein